MAIASPVDLPAKPPAASLPAGAAPAAAPTPTPARAAATSPAAPGSAALAATEASTARPAQTQAAAFPDIRPRLSVEQRDLARRQAEQLRAQQPQQVGAAGAAAAVGALGAAGPAGTAATRAAAAEDRVFALVTRTTRGRAASEVMLSLMVTAAAGAAWPGQPRTEVLQVPQGWRAVWWPFGTPADAELARASLALYGIKAEIVEF